MHFTFRGLAGIDSYGDFRVSGKDSVETVEVLARRAAFTKKHC